MSVSDDPSLLPSIPDRISLTSAGEPRLSLFLFIMVGTKHLRRHRAEAPHFPLPIPKLLIGDADCGSGSGRCQSQRSRPRGCAPRTLRAVEQGHEQVVVAVLQELGLIRSPRHRRRALHGNGGREAATGESGWIFVTEEQVR